MQEKESQKDSKEKIGAVIVAAGLSSRMHDFKPMMQIGTISIMERVISTFQQANVDWIVVVTGHNAKQLERHLFTYSVICLHNKDYATTQMFDSAKIGLSYLQKKCDAIFFTPVDVPLFTVKTLEKLKETKAPVVKPVCNGKGGHPLLIRKEVLPSILAYDGDMGLKGALNHMDQEIRNVPVADEGILYDADTPEDYKKLLVYHNKQLLRMELAIGIAKETTFLNQKSANLLQLIEEQKSVRIACEEANYSYGKAWEVINQMENQMGFCIVKRQQGGVEGGYSTLTAEGKKLLQTYLDFQKEAAVQLQGLFEAHFQPYFKVKK